MSLILCINPGSTSTKIALFDDDTELFRKNIAHTPEELSAFSCNNDQIPYRKRLIEDTLRDEGYSISDIDAFSGRGGGQCSHEGGTYRVNEIMVQQAHDEVYAQHPALLACQICYLFEKETGSPAFMTNSPSTDEMRDVARITGIKGVYRICYCHALNQKEIAQRYAESQGRPYEDLNLVICHIGGGISVSAHAHGRIVDTNDILNGDGPMAPNRTGSIPAKDIIGACFVEGATREDVTAFVRSRGGIFDHLETYDMLEVKRRISEGDRYAQIVYDAMAYQIAKYIGSMAVAIGSAPDAVILTGGIANDDYLCDFIEHQAGWIAKIVRMPGEFEMEALAHGAASALRHGAREYTGVPIWDESMLFVSKGSSVGLRTFREQHL